MSEAEERQEERSPLVSERGVTSIKDGVVSRIAGMAAQEVEGVHMGGSGARAATGVLGSITGSDSQTRGVSVSVGRVETAIDLTMGVDYGRNFLETVEDVRSRIVERVESLTGLRVVECNATISDVIFPDSGDGRRSELGPASGPETTADGELAAGERENSETSASAETRAGDRPRDEDETRVLRTGDGETESSDEVGTSDEARAEDETREFERGPLADDEPERDERS